MSHSFSFLAFESPSALRRCIFFRRAQGGQDALTNSRFPPVVSITNNHLFLYLAVLTGGFSFASKLCSALIWAASKDKTTSQATPGISSKEMGQIQSCKLASMCKSLHQESWSTAWGEFVRGLWAVNGDFQGDLKLKPVVFGITQMNGAALLLLS